MKRVLLFALLLVCACQRVEHKADGLPQQAEALVQQAKEELDNQHFDAALEKLAANPGMLNREVATYVENAIAVRAQKIADIGLSQREIQIIRLSAQGLTAAEIAQKLYLSVHTVNTHRQRIYSKMDVKNVSDMLRRATELGII